jgi:hypothetical protein
MTPVRTKTQASAWSRAFDALTDPTDQGVRRDQFDPMQIEWEEDDALPHTGCRAPGHPSTPLADTQQRLLSA